MGIVRGMPLQTGIAQYFWEDVDATFVSLHLLVTETVGWVIFFMDSEIAASQMLKIMFYFLN